MLSIGQQTGQIVTCDKLVYGKHVQVTMDIKHKQPLGLLYLKPNAE